MGSADAAYKDCDAKENCTDGDDLIACILMHYQVLFSKSNLIRESESISLDVRQFARELG